ncbi:MAG: ABC transporter substrate-binding protein [Actinobacteria bacterium]|nr:ABC transporter substrate-binding protein [Actinomycetota bacterium]
MSISKRWAVAGVLLAAAMATLAAFVGATSAGDTATKPIVIGWAGDLTKNMAPFDGPGYAAAQIKVKEINAKGGVKGRPLQLKFINTQLDPAKTKQAAADLIQGGADVLMVTCDVDFATPAIQEGLNAGKLTVSACIGTDQMGPKRFGSKGKLAFSFGNAAQDEGAAMAEYAIGRGWKTAIVVKDNLLVYFKNANDAFAKRFTEKGGKVVYRDSFTSFDKTINSVVSRVNGKQADVISFVTAFGELPQFVAGLRSLGNKTPILNSWGGDGTYWNPKRPKVTNYYYVTYASAFGDDPNPAVNRLAAQMKAAGKAPGTASFVQGPTAIEGIVAAINRAGGSTDGAKLAAQMEKFKGLKTISGSVSFSPSFHSVTGRAYRVMVINNNKAKYLRRITASSPAKIG